VRCLDMSDTYVMAAVSHPADAFPAVLAVAEAERRSGRDLLLATALIYEVQCRFVEVVPYNHHGWDQTPVVALGAALGCARLLGLDDAQTRHAISLAVVPNLALNQTRTGTLSMWKGMAGPQGARAGVFAAYLAREGMTGPDGVFEGRFGLWQQMMQGKTFDLPIPTDFGNHTFAVQQTMIKSFPTRFNCQVPVFTAQKLRSMLEIDQIASLRIESIRQAFARWMDLPEIWQPQTRETADHSLPCTVAMGLLDGTITPAMMARGRFKDADVLALMAKCTIELPDEFAQLAPETRCCRITATLKNGQTVAAETGRSLADDIADPGWTQAADKFHALTAPLLVEKTREQLLAWVDNMENQCAVDGLPALTKL
jgi:2-methylcitrate dehydratase